jgi:glycosyltransferase involved in cell wall biosynthesis
LIDSNKLDISVVILTKNEERVIERCIASVPFAREICVFDSGSSDATCQIAEGLGARVVNLPWPGDFAVQRNIADSHTRSGWVLHLDADETVSSELAAEISDFFVNNLEMKYSAGQFPRKELIFGKWIEHGGWYPQYKLRLYRQGSGKWTGKVHEHFEGVGNVFSFTSVMLHDSYKDIQTFLEKFNKYTSIGVEKEFIERKKFNLYKVFLQPAERFIGRYICHKGYRDGFHGFVLASLIAFSYFISNLKLWEKYYKENNDHRIERQRKK